MSSIGVLWPSYENLKFIVIPFTFHLSHLIIAQLFLMAKEKSPRYETVGNPRFDTHANFVSIGRPIICAISANSRCRC